jgi:hypothetical protein
MSADKELVMTEKDVRCLLDEAADFLRGGDVTAAFTRANEAVSACELLPARRGDLAQEARLVRDRCAAAAARSQTTDVLREDKYRARELQDAQSHQHK